jgi:ribosomal silencing factor RsfS
MDEQFPCNANQEVIIRTTSSDKQVEAIATDLGFEKLTCTGA